MLQFNNTQLTALSIHWVGNKLQEEGLQLSKTPVTPLQAPLTDLLTSYFLTPFKTQESFTLHHETDLNLNEVYHYAKQLFADPEQLHKQAENIAQHLYANSMHHKIKGGELYVAYFKDCELEGDLTDAIGIFKSENKDTYLKVFPEGDGYQVNSDTGINLHKLDKGCLIFNTDAESGYRVMLVDSSRNETQYWKDDFLKARPRADNYQHTKHYVNLCKSFATEQLSKEFDANRSDEIALLNKTAAYFKQNDTFELNEFASQVLQQEDLISTFKEYKQEFQRSHALEIKDEFMISEAALKKGSKVFKSVLKLDKNFHIYIHGDRDLIERGTDSATGRNYYKLYFTNES